MTITNYRKKVGQTIQDTASILKAADIDAFITEAVHRYERHRPLIAVVATAGDGGFDYAMPTGWIKGFSTIHQIEYPAGQREPSVIDQDDFLVYSGPSGQVIRFAAHTPASTEAFNTTFTAAHAVDESADTVVQTDFDAVCNLASALCCEALASYFSQQTDATILADSVEHKTRAQEYASRATRLRKLYLDHLGIKEGGGVRAASGVKDLDTLTSWGGSRLIRDNRNR